jgi:phytoene/squalene synthetase
MSKERERADDGPVGPAEARPRRRVVSLLGQRPDPGEAPPPGGGPDPQRDPQTGERPTRAGGGGPDPLRSEHSTFRDLEPPRDDFDPERARAVCAQIARDALRDFAPALVLLPSEERLRAQAVIAYARTLLDFARDRSLEGERLAQINRFEFALEAALGGEPPGQPVFVQLAALERLRAWPREAFDAFAAIARSRVSLGLPRRGDTAEAQRRRLAGAALHAVFGAPPAPELEALGAAILRAGSLAAWHDALWFHRPELGLSQQDAPSARFGEAVAAEGDAVVAALAAAAGACDTLPARLRPTVRYAERAAAVLARAAAARPDEAAPPRLSVVERLWLLLRARLGA